MKRVEPRPAGHPSSQAGLAADGEPLFELIELFFFAYRDFVSEPDRVLARDGFGRAHHRVLHFVHRRPGLNVQELLDILRITKQSLNRVLKELIGSGYIEQQEGVSDRRQRLLFASAKGKALARELAALQDRRIRAALASAPDGAASEIAAFLRGMMDAGARQQAPLLRGERNPDGGETSA
ncbi:MAG: MarR family winged helix-turn-helix transcriptional regulator [Beijerinckiaceae bacterium]